MLKKIVYQFINDNESGELLTIVDSYAFHHLTLKINDEYLLINKSCVEEIIIALEEINRCYQKEIENLEKGVI